MRWLRASHPDAQLSGCELQADALSFCAETFDAETWESSAHVEGLKAPRKYDLIWAGSVITHLSADKTEALFRKFLSWTNRGGMIVVTAHGRFAYARRAAGKYIDEKCLPAIETEYERDGYGYSNHPGSKQYGISFLKPQWALDLICRLTQCRLVAYSERAWDGHHDVIALQAT
jgi:hypothetical protein